MSSDAERQRRHRRHKADDHRLCLPHNCISAGHGTGVTAVTRGVTLWRDLNGDTLPPAERVLLEEACRIADRLDKLDRLLDGDADTWLTLVEDRGDPDRQTVVVDKPLAEARQQALALKQIVAELRASGAAHPSSRPAGGLAGRGTADVVDLTAWSPARSAKPAR
jgi:hypothetical protein